MQNTHHHHHQQQQQQQQQKPQQQMVIPHGLSNSIAPHVGPMPTYRRTQETFATDLHPQQEQQQTQPYAFDNPHHSYSPYNSMHDGYSPLQQHGSVASAVDASDPEYDSESSEEEYLDASRGLVKKVRWFGIRPSSFVFTVWACMLMVGFTASQQLGHDWFSEV